MSNRKLGYFACISDSLIAVDISNIFSHFRHRVAMRCKWMETRIHRPPPDGVDVALMYSLPDSGLPPIFLEPIEELY